jgi:alkanesulfonate monooxygenase SsuD/methylene tetrahydromethanopterin reductase-like flavin-dependent oxidoreductase (luciferase family)
VMGSELMRSTAAIGSPAEVTERILALADAGADTVYLHIYDIHDLDHIALIGAEVLPHVTSTPERTGAR